MIETDMSPDAKKVVFSVSALVQHKSACAVTEAGYSLEISELRRRLILLFL